MKLLVYILSVYIVALTLIPCVDVPSDVHVQSQALTAQNGVPHQDATDICSPFCSCNCCSSPLVFLASAIVIKADAPSATTLFDTDKRTTIQHFHAIWQPPKLG